MQHSQTNLADALANGMRGDWTQAAVCPHCAAFTTFEAVAKADGSNCPAFKSTRYTRSILLRCRACKNGILTFLGGTENLVGAIAWPLAGWPDSAPPGVPESIKRAYDEARAVAPLSPMATAILARRCLQHLIRDHLGIKEATLFKEIAKAVLDDRLSKPTRAELDHVRQIGNWGAHPTESDSVNQGTTIIEVTDPEAKYTLRVVEHVMDDLFRRPARQQEMAGLIAAK